MTWPRLCNWQSSDSNSGPPSPMPPAEVCFCFLLINNDFNVSGTRHSGSTTGPAPPSGVSAELPSSNWCPHLLGSPRVWTEQEYMCPLACYMPQWKGFRVYLSLKTISFHTGLPREPQYSQTGHFLSPVFPNKTPNLLQGLSTFHQKVQDSGDPCSTASIPGID